MEEWIVEIMNQFGYIGIFLLIAVENIFPPIPSEVILTLGGFMTTHTNMSITGVVVASTSGSIAGAVLLYGLGAWFEVSRMEKFVDKYGRVLRLTANDIHKAHAWFNKYGTWAVLIGRLIPLIRSLISIPAGSVRMNFAVFLGLTTLGSLIWNLVLIQVGAAVGASWDTIVGYMDVYSNIVYLVLILIVLLSIWLFIRKRFMQADKTSHNRKK